VALERPFYPLENISVVILYGYDLFWLGGDVGMNVATCKMNAIIDNLDHHRTNKRPENKATGNNGHLIPDTVKGLADSPHRLMAYVVRRIALIKLGGDIMKTFEYHIDLDERGSFLADVRDENGKTVFEIKAGNELEDGESSIFEDGFMKHPKDIDHLRLYLVSLGIISADDELVFG